MKLKYMIMLMSLLFLFACNNGLTGQVVKETTTVKIGHLPAVHALPFYLALEKGYFAEEGINVEVVKFDSPNLFVQALMTGQIDMGSTSTAAGITSIAESQKPGELKIYAVSGSTTLEPNMISEGLLVRKDSVLTSVKDLKGKKLGILPSIQWRTIAKDMLVQEGLIADTDVIMVELAPGLMAQALATGQIDAVLAIEPVGTTTRLKGISKELVHAAVETYIADPMYAGAGVLRTEFAEKNPETTAKILKVMRKATVEMYANPEESRKYLPKYTPLDADLAEQVPTVVIKYSDEMTNQDIDALQKFFDIFYTYNVTQRRVDVRSILYMG